MNLQVIQGIEGYEENGIVYLRLETVARGLGFVDSSKGDKEYVRWNVIKQYLSDLGFSQEVAKDDFIPENIFYRLAMKAKNEMAEAFQAKVADEIIPTLRRTGSYSLHSFPPFDFAKSLYELAGLKDNQLALAMDKIYQKHMGYSALTAAGIQLKAPELEQLLTATEIGEKIGQSARMINALLIAMNYQRKAGRSYEPIGEGKHYGVMLDVGKRSSSGTPVRQLKWKSSIVDVLKCERMTS